METAGNRLQTEDLWRTIPREGPVQPGPQAARILEGQIPRRPLCCTPGWLATKSTKDTKLGVFRRICGWLAVFPVHV